MSKQTGTERLIDGPRHDILEALRRHGSMTIDELGELLSLSKTATRAHVLQLEEAELIVREEPAPDRPGRPPARFALTRQGGETFPTQDAEILERLLGYLDREGHGGLIETFFQKVWLERRKSLLCRLGVEAFGQVPLKDRIACLNRVLEESDFMPSIACHESGGSGASVVIRECNCPLPAAVRATKVPCRMEVRFLEEVLGARAVETRIASNRSQTCCFEFIVDELP